MYVHLICWSLCLIVTFTSDQSSYFYCSTTSFQFISIIFIFYQQKIRITDVDEEKYCIIRVGRHPVFKQ